MRALGIGLALCVLLSSLAGAQEPLEKLFDRGKAAPPGSPSLLPGAQAPSDKLISPEEIEAGFARGPQGRAEVVVNLVEPPQAQRGDWNDRKFLDGLKRAVAERQNAVISPLSKSELRLRRRMTLQAGFSAEVSREALGALQADPLVQSIEPIQYFEFHLRQGLEIIHALAPRQKYKGEGLAIAIVDSGVDYRHPALGWGAFPNQKVIGGYDVADNDADPLDEQVGHGTSCAGIAAGNAAEVGDYVGGVASSAKLYAVKVNPKNVQGIPFDLIMVAWNWCVEHKNDDPNHPILIVSTSIGGARSSARCDAALPGLSRASKLLENAGISLFVSSGNNGFGDSMCAPACLESAISVGAVYDGAFAPQAVFPVDPSSCANMSPEPASPTGYVCIEKPEARKVASYSNTAPFLDLLAPSHCAISTDLVGQAGYAPGDYSAPPMGFGGTSAACPYAAGTAACLQQAAREMLGRYLTPGEVRNILVATGEPIQDHRVPIVKPLINLEKAIAAVAQMQQGGPTPTPTPTPTPSAGSQPVLSAGILSARSTILITDPSGQQQYNAAPPNQEVFLTIKVEAASAPSSSDIVEVMVWTFFDAEGVWLKDRTVMDFLQPQAGERAYQVRYMAPQDGRGEYAHFALLWINQRSTQMVDEVNAVRLIPIGQAPAQPQAAAGLKPERVRMALGGRSEDLAYIAAPFRTRRGRDGLEVSLRVQREGGKVRFQLQANRDCQALLLNLTSGGQLRLIVPLGVPMRLRAGETTAFPSEGGLELAGPQGQERLAVLALERPKASSADDPAATVRRWIAAGCATDAVAIAVEQGGPPVARRFEATAMPSKPSEQANKAKESLEKLFDR